MYFDKSLQKKKHSYDERFYRELVFVFEILEFCFEKLSSRINNKNASKCFNLFPTQVEIQVLIEKRNLQIFQA